MKKAVIISVVLLLSSLLGLGADNRQSVGLVLSGGGAKGIAHVGVIKALEENGIPIDYVAGTSMGAIVGGLYASGFTSDEILELILSEDFSNWSTGTIDNDLTYYYLKPEKTPAFVTFDIGKRDSTAKSSKILPHSFINPIPMNFGFVELFAPQTAACKGNFDDLFVPFRCVASDVYNKHKVVLSSGNLGDAIRMSMTFPVAFKPIEKDGIPMFDGGIYDNFPVDVMKADFAPDIIIGVDVTSHDATDADNLISQLESMIIQQKDYNLDPEDGIKIHVDLKGVGLLDFPKAKQISEKGYERAMEFMDSIKCRVGGRISPDVVDWRREVYKCGIPKVIFDSVSVVGSQRRTEAYIRHIFEKNKCDTFGLKEAKDAYYRTVASGKFKDFLPMVSYRPEKDMFDLAFKVDTKDDLSLGLGGYITSSTNSMIFVSAGYENLNLSSFSAKLMGWVGQSYYAGMFDAKISMINFAVPAMLKLQAAASQQRFYEDEVLFFDDNLPTFITANNYYANLILGTGIGRHAKINASLGFGYLRDRFYPNNNVDFSKVKQDEGRYKLGQLRLKYEYNTIDNEAYPVAGTQCIVSVSGISGKRKYLSANDVDATTPYKNVYWGEAEISGQKYFGISKKFVLGAKFDVLASTKKMYENYTSAIVQAPAFTPTQSSRGFFSPKLRANSFVAGGIVPVFRIMDNLQFRTELYAFSPMRDMKGDANGNAYYGDWFGSLEFMGEASVVYNFPFASLSVYGNYYNYPGHNWNFGISFGIFLTAPKFLR